MSPVITQRTRSETKEGALISHLKRAINSRNYIGREKAELRWQNDPDLGVVLNDIAAVLTDTEATTP